MQNFRALEAPPRDPQISQPRCEFLAPRLHQPAVGQSCLDFGILLSQAAAESKRYLVFNDKMIQKIFFLYLK